MEFSGAFVYRFVRFESGVESNRIESERKFGDGDGDGDCEQSDGCEDL